MEWSFELKCIETGLSTDEDGGAVENFCNTLFKCINYNLHEEMFCFNVFKNRDICFGLWCFTDKDINIL
jgi:hypothetical protein